MPVTGLLAVHALALVASNTAMAACFVGRARGLGLSPLAAVVFWMVGLNATFAAILFALVRLGVFA